MLVLSRRLGEVIYIGDDIIITLVDIDNGKVRLGIDAPRSIVIERSEVRIARLKDETAAKTE